MRFSKIKQKIKNKTHSLHAQKSASLCLLKRGGLTIETALVLPLFFMAMLTLICFMYAVKAQVKESVDTAEQAKELGMYAYLSSESAGKDGIIDLGHRGSYHFPLQVFPIKDLSFWVSGRVRAWTGYEKGSAEKLIEESDMVYVSDYESVYHKDALCSYINVSVIEMSKNSIKEKRNAYGNHYKVCEKCGSYHGESVYITSRGNAYHMDKNCSGLKRSGRLVDSKELQGLTACTRCGKVHGQ